jgi:hypothetical protein
LFFMGIIKRIINRKEMARRMHLVESLDRFVGLPDSRIMARDADKSLCNGVVEITNNRGGHVANGLLVTREGYFLTVGHVIGEGRLEHSNLVLDGGPTYAVERVCAVNPREDLALAKAQIYFKTKPSLHPFSYRFSLSQGGTSKDAPFPAVLLTRRCGELISGVGEIPSLEESKDYVSGGGVVPNFHEGHFVFSLRSKPGDSGGVVFGRNKAIVGLVSSSSNESTLCCRIDTALELVRFYSEAVRSDFCGERMSVSYCSNDTCERKRKGIGFSNEDIRYCGGCGSNLFVGEIVSGEEPLRGFPDVIVGGFRKWGENRRDKKERREKQKQMEMREDMRREEKERKLAQWMNDVPNTLNRIGQEDLRGSGLDRVLTFFHQVDETVGARERFGKLLADHSGTYYHLGNLRNLLQVPEVGQRVKVTGTDKRWVGTKQDTEYVTQRNASFLIGSEGTVLDVIDRPRDGYPGHTNASKITNAVVVRFEDLEGKGWRESWLHFGNYAMDYWTGGKKNAGLYYPEELDDVDRGRGGKRRKTLSHIESIMRKISNHHYFPPLE